MTIQVKEKYKMFIGGEWKEASNGQWVETHNPATGELLSKVPQASKEDVDDAVVAARKAFESFKDSTGPERQKLLLKIADIIDENAEYLATLESMENGKPIRETMNADIPLAADHFRYFAAAARMAEGTAQMLDKNTMNLILHEPIGVVGQIVPWNFPFLMAAWKLAPVIAAGDTSVLKPSSSTSLSVLALMELIQDILPKGVINIITGSGSKSGEYLQNHTGIDKLAFTGSTEVGREIGLSAAKRIIPATLELGGKSANVFFEDANMDLALEGVQLGILFNQGQVCSAGSRIFVQESFYDTFVEKVIEAFKKVKVGDPLDPETQMGAQSSPRQLEKILKYVDIAKEEGAKILTGGNKMDKEGVFMEPTLIGEATNEMRVAREEIFGPVGVIIKFKDEEDLIRMANDSDFGLGGGVFTQDINRAMRVANSIRTGRVWINTFNVFPAGAPFGGYKDSGIGRETHKVILDHYTQMKNIIVNLNDVPGGIYVNRQINTN